MMQLLFLNKDHYNRLIRELKENYISEIKDMYRLYILRKFTLQEKEKLKQKNIDKIKIYLETEKKLKDTCNSLNIPYMEPKKFPGSGKIWLSNRREWINWEKEDNGRRIIIKKLIRQFEEEVYIKTLCDTHGIEYTPPNKIVNAYQQNNTDNFIYSRRLTINNLKKIKIEKIKVAWENLDEKKKIRYLHYVSTKMQEEFERQKKIDERNKILEEERLKRVEEYRKQKLNEKNNIEKSRKSSFDDEHTGEYFVIGNTGGQSGERKVKVFGTLGKELMKPDNH